MIQRGKGHNSGGRVACRPSSALVVALPLLANPYAHAQVSAPSPPNKTYAGDQGRVGDPASWRTPEFLRDNGMLSIDAEYACAAGYSGAGENIGIVAQGGHTGPTSGFYDQSIN